MHTGFGDVHARGLRVEMIVVELWSSCEGLLHVGAGGKLAQRRFVHYLLLQIGQRHGGFLGILQRALARASPHIWFERSEVRDRHAVANK